MRFSFKPSFWFPIAAIACGVNVVWAWIAGRTGPMAGPHAMGHAIAALAFGLWAATLRSQLRSEQQPPGRPELPEHLEEIEAEMSNLRQQLIETQERLDFTERLLAQRENERVKQDR
jgi:hypothetical protein